MCDVCSGLNKKETKSRACWPLIELRVRELRPKPINGKALAQQERVDCGNIFFQHNSHQVLSNTIRKINIFTLAGVSVSLNREKI